MSDGIDDADDLRDRIDDLERARDDAQSIVFLERDDAGEWAWYSGGDRLDPATARERGSLFITLEPTAEHRIDPETLEVESVHPLDPATGDAVDAVELDPSTYEVIRDERAALEDPDGGGDGTSADAGE